MRLSRAVDQWLVYLQVETDATDRTIQSYAWVLGKLCDHLGSDAALASLDGKPGTETLRGFLAPWARLSASSRANRISVLRSFFEWAEREELISDSPARRIQRPPKRKANVYRPTAAELDLLRHAAGHPAPPG